MSENKRKTERTLNKNIIERLIIITNLIKSGVYPNNKQLRDFYREQTGETVSETTISRDIETLRVYFHAPLEFHRSKNGFYFIDDKWQFALNTISSEEIFYLSAAKTLLAGLEGSPLYASISSVINFVISTNTLTEQPLLKRIAVPPKPKFLIDSAIWKTLSTALLENKIITFDYKDIARTVRPYQLLLDSGKCFLYGYAEERGDTRFFNIARIKNLCVTEKSFELPEDFDFSAKCGGGKFGAYSSNRSEEYVIDFYSTARAMVKDCVWADDHPIINYDEDDCTQIRFSSTQSEKILEWVLSQGGNAMPRSPVSFVSAWKEQIELMSENSAAV